jgi:hypothetical protein
MRSRSTRGYALGAVLAGLAAGLAMLVPAAGAGAQIVTPASARAATPDVGGQTVYNDASGLCLDMTNESTSINAQPQLYTCNGGTQQEWTFIALNDFSFLIQNVHSGLCLSIYQNDPSPGGEVIQYNCNFSGTDLFEEWSTTQVPSEGGEVYELLNVGAGLVMHPSGCGTTNGTKMFMNYPDDCFNNNLWS